MQNFTTLTQATTYVYNYLKDINPIIEEEDVYDSMLDEVIASIGYLLNDDDIRVLEKNSNNKQFIDEYLSKKIPDFADLLDDIVIDIVSEEILEE